MDTFTVHTLDSAPADSKPLLEATKKAWGFLPTLQATLAHSPVALEAHERLFALVGKTSFSPIEQQVALLAVSVFNGCEYCTMGHTYLARAAKAPEPVVQAMRNRTEVPDARLQALRTFTEAVVRERGHAGDAAVEAFLAAGFTQAQVLELLVVIALKTISNYANHLTHTPKESFMSDPALAWSAA
jgi:uncharacterized peroxidase-related enzyme